MAWLAFTKKSQIRKVALLEFKHLLNILEKTSGIPPDFYDDPYVVGFFFGYTMGVGAYVGGKAVKPTDVNSAWVDMIFELVPDRGLIVAKKFAEWSASREPSFNEGENNGTLFALYSYKAARLDDNPIIFEAQLKAQAMAPMLEKLDQNPDAHSRVMCALRNMLFWDRIKHREG